jgi:hypothetical protein
MRIEQVLIICVRFAFLLFQPVRRLVHVGVVAVDVLRGGGAPEGRGALPGAVRVAGAGHVLPGLEHRFIRRACLQQDQLLRNYGKPFYRCFYVFRCV